MLTGALRLSSALLALGGMAALGAQAPATRARLGWRPQGGGRRLGQVIAGAGLLALAFVVAWEVDGPGFAPVWWIGEAGVSGLAFVLALPFRPSLVVRCAAISVAAGLLLVLFAWMGS